MATNLEKFKAAERRIDDAARAYVLLKYGSVPETLWRVGGAGLEFAPEEWKTADVSLVRPPGMWFQKRPSREQVAKMEAFAEQPLDPTDICIHVQQENGRKSTGVRLNDLSEEKTWSICKDTIEARAAHLREIYIPKEGQFKCRYCGKATDNDQKVVGTIIARQYPNMRAKFDYCSSQCNSYDQMAHEG